MSSTAMHSSLTDPEKLEVCPYDPNHLIRRCKMIVHLNRCKKNNPVAIKSSKKVKTCPFDATHVVPVIEFELHKLICPANNIQQDIIHELESTERVDDMPIINHNITSSEDWECDQAVSAPFFLNGNPMIRLPNHVRNAPTVPPTTGDVHKLQQAVRDRQSPVASSVSENVPHSVPCMPSPLDFAVAPDGARPFRLAGTGRGEPKLKGPPSLQPPPGFSQTQLRTATASAAFNVSMLSGKAAKVNVDFKSPQNHKDYSKLASASTNCVRAAHREDNSETLSITDDSLSATEVKFDPQKELRKLRKKLKAIVQLEKDEENGKELNDDQLQKIASKGTIEEQMRNLQLQL